MNETPILTPQELDDKAFEVANGRVDGHLNVISFSHEALRARVTELQAEVTRLTAERDALAQADARLREALVGYDTAADKFIAKVKSGRAQSRETYEDLRACRELSRAALTAPADPTGGQE